MKKTIALVLVMMLVITSGVSSFAAGSGNGSLTSGNGSVDADVNGQYVAGSSGEVVYSVDISWSNLSFTYQAPDMVWDETNHRYNPVGGGWMNSNAKIDVVNHSNTAIVATPTWKPLQNYSSATMTFDCGASGLSLSSADNGGGANGSATSGTIKITPGGTLPKDTNGNIGQITISIARATRSAPVNLSLSSSCAMHPIIESEVNYEYAVKEITVQFFDRNGVEVPDSEVVFNNNNVNLTTPENAYQFKVVTTFIKNPDDGIYNKLESDLTVIPSSSSNVHVSYGWVEAAPGDNTQLDGYVRSADVTVTSVS